MVFLCSLPIQIHFGGIYKSKCKTMSAPSRTVSWMRHRDIHLLTAGKDSYTDDRRFSAHHPILSSHWQLRVKNVSKR